MGIVDERGPRALGMTLGVPSFDRYWAHRFMHALGSPNVYGADGACEVSRLTGWEHSLGYSPASDLAHTDCIMYLGRSIVDSSTMGAVDALNDARRRGAKSSWLTLGAAVRLLLPIAGSACVPDAIWRCCWVSHTC